MSAKLPSPDPEFDAAMMRLAIEEAHKAMPSPNPPVGAVVVNTAGEVVAVAHHARAGEEHAEGLALAMAGDVARGGTLYVTLEPCYPEGRTPPCVDAVLSAGITPAPSVNPDRVRDARPQPAHRDAGRPEGPPVPACAAE